MPGNPMLGKIDRNLSFYLKKILH